MEIKQPQYDVGVIIGRFQVPQLHKSHYELIDYVYKRHSKVLIILGTSPVPVSRRDPLDFQAREQMIREEFSQVLITQVQDRATNKAWSDAIDRAVEAHTAVQSAVLYGSRDSFAEHYEGKYPVYELDSPAAPHSGTAVRADVAKSRTRSSEDFRAGVIWAAHNRFPCVYPTVDVAIFNEDEKKILLGKKPDETKWRLIGGFASIFSLTWEADVRREVEEETGLDITDPYYIGGGIIDDWRYPVDGVDRIKTLLFGCRKFAGVERAADDIAALSWFDIGELYMNDIVTNHQILVRLALKQKQRAQV